MRDNLIIFPATKNYLGEAKALLRSLLVHMPDVPVHVISRNGEAKELQEFKNVELIVDEPMPTEGFNPEFRQVRTSRYLHAAKMKDEYKVCAILDADMISVRPMYPIFKMAETGVILVGSDSTIYRYKKSEFDKYYITAPDDIDVVHAAFSSVPMILNPSVHETFLREIWGNKTGNDLSVPNLLSRVLTYMGEPLYDRHIHFLNSFDFTNLHHNMEKMQTHIKDTGQGYYSNMGDFVYMIHGPMYKPEYRKQLLDPMLKNFSYYKPYIDCAKNCIEIMVKEYMKYYKAE